MPKDDQHTMSDMPEPAWLVPHATPMVLLSRIVWRKANAILAEVDHTQDTQYRSSDGVTPAWVALEYMAQTVAAYAGWKRRDEGRKPDLGFLLGTRKFTVSVAGFAPGERLQIQAAPILESDTEISIFQCDLFDSTQKHIGSAQLKGVQPQNPDALLS